MRELRIAEGTTLAVPSAATVSVGWILFNRAIAGEHTVLVGGPGTGKSVALAALRSAPQQLHPWAPVDVACARGTTASDLLDMLEKTLERKRAGVIGSAAGVSCLLILDDLHLAAPDQTGTGGTAHELVRELLDRGGCRERGTWEWRSVVDVSIVAAAQEQTAPRLRRQLSVNKAVAPTTQAVG